MKKLLVIVLSMLMLLTPMGALAEETISDELGGQAPVVDTIEPEPVRISSEVFGDFIVGTTTTPNGDFFTSMWGNNASDIDVRSMLHGYDIVYWNTQSSFAPNETVLTGLAAVSDTDGNKTYTIKLQQDLTYNDGTPITAKDYVFSLMLQGAPQIAELGGTTTSVGHIVGFEDYNSGTTDYFAGLRLIDDYTFTLTIKADYLPFFYELGMIAAIPYPISVIAPGCEVVDKGQGTVIQNSDPSVQAPIFTAELLKKTVMDPETGYMSHPYVSCGPYRLTSFDWETRIIKVEINPNFKGDWNGQKPTIDKVIFKSVLPETMMDELESGDVHLLNKVVAGKDITEGLSMDVSYEPYPRMGFGFINFSCETGPMQFEAVRKSVAYSLDLTKFIADYTQSYGLPVYGYYGIGQWMITLLNAAAQTTPDASDPEAALWSTLSIGRLNTYEQSIETAKQLLIDDGWTLNANGEPYQEGVDEYRCKMVNDELMPLIIKWGKTKDSEAADVLENLLVEPLTGIGMKLEITEVPFVELLEHYYRQRDRTYDMIYMATNFGSIFDPYFVFNTRDAYQGHQNSTGYRDAALEALALNLRRTEPGQMFEYCQKWVAFQTYFNEKLPLLPLYGNVYYDFHTPYLQGYQPNAPEMQNWPTALLYAYLAEPVVAAEEAEVAGTEDVAATVDEGAENTADQ